MEEKKIKKKKLTISVSSKRSDNFANFQKDNKKAVIIEKKPARRGNERRFFNRV